MAYSIFVSPRAQKEIENAIDFYVIHSEDAPKRFLKMLISSYWSSPLLIGQFDFSMR